MSRAKEKEREDSPLSISAATALFFSSLYYLFPFTTLILIFEI